METTKIKNVAIYLRKSRDEDTIKDVLSKHRATLTALAETNKWNYTIYEEDIRSGEELDTRPVLVGLLQKIEENPDLYNAIMAMDYDRLSRGDSADFSKIKRLLIYAHVYLVTTESIYDMSRTGDSMLIGVKSVVASSELTQIKKRFKEGKIASAKRGKFSNGDAPYPYIKHYIYSDKNGNKIEKLDNETDDEYRARIFNLVENKEAKIDFEIVVDDERREVYNFIKDSFLYKRMSLTKITQELNAHHIPTMYQDKYPNSKWAVTTIRRILQNRVHCGYFCFNKKNHKYLPLSDKHVIVNNDESDWIIGKGKHEILKTEEEHEKIMALLGENEDFPKHSPIGKYTFSSLIYCAKCKRAMIFQKNKRANKDGVIYIYIACHRALYPKCKQRGCRMDNDIENVIINAIKVKIKDKIALDNVLQVNFKSIEKEIFKINASIKKHEKALEKIKHAYEEDLYTDIEYKEARSFRLSEIEKLNRKVDDLRKNSLKRSDINYTEILDFLNTKFVNLEPFEKNIFLKSFVNKIWYNREGKQVSWNFEFI